MVLILYACNSEQSIPAYGYFLSETKEFTIPIDSSISPIPAAVQFVPDENIVVLNNRYANDRSLIVLNASDLVFSHKIKFESEGENSPQANPLNFYYHNKDTLFLVNIFSKKIYLLDSTSKKIHKTFDFNGLAAFISQWQLSMGQNEGYFDKGVFQIVCEPNDMVNSKKSRNDPLLASLNLKNEEMKVSKLTYELNNTYNFPFQHPWLQIPITTNTKKGTLLTFGQSKSIYLINKDSIIKEIPLQSDFFVAFEKMKKNDIQDLEKFYIESFSIDRILHDFVNGFTYVFIFHAMPYVNQDTGNINTYQDKPFSIIVFDKNFKKVTEQKFEGGKYSLMGSFVTPEGLFLSLNNPHSDIFDENMFKFKLFKLTHK